MKGNGVDIFLIQETKLVAKDKTPKFPGYTVLRRDRLQQKGMEKNRGGGLLIGIKDNFPLREAKIDLQDKEDEITESLSKEFQQKSNRS